MKRTVERSVNRIRRRMSGRRRADMGGIPQRSVLDRPGGCPRVKSSPGAARGFCPCCGSPMFFKSQRWPDRCTSRAHSSPIHWTATRRCTCITITTFRGWRSTTIAQETGYDVGSGRTELCNGHRTRSHYRAVPKPSRCSKAARRDPALRRPKRRRRSARSTSTQSDARRRSGRR